MSTKQRLATGEKRGTDALYYFNGQVVTGREITSTQEVEIAKTMGWTAGTYEDDRNGIDYYTPDGKSAQFKTINGSAACSITPKEAFPFNKNEGIHPRNYWKFKKWLKAYCKQFDFLVVHFANAEYSEHWDINNVIIIENSEGACYDFFETRLYRRYTYNNQAQIAANKTPKSEIDMSEEERNVKLLNVYNHCIFLGNNKKVHEKIARKYLGIKQV